MVVKHPMMTWAQRASHIYLSIEVSDMKVEELSLDGDSFKLRGTKGADSYEADLQLYGKVKGDQRCQTGTDRRVELFLPKVDAEWWPRLLAEQTKVPWIKVDFDKWADDDEEGPSFEDGGDDFGGIDFTKLGVDSGTALGDMGGEDWSADDDYDGGNLSDDDDPVQSDKPPSSNEKSGKDDEEEKESPGEPAAHEKPSATPADPPADK